MHRRLILAAAPALVLPPALAHHGWSSFDQARPLYLGGRATNVQWRNPHAELDLELPAEPRLPADLAARPVPPQAAQVDGTALLKAAMLPTRKDRRWRVELAPLTRMQAWGVPEIRAGDTVGVVGFTFAGEKGEAILRAEYVFVGGRTFGLRSAPA
ncbi:MAG: DUF6152 family protein [Pseudomonadota bacterium]|jgi:hypothetical protein|nr:hypothetical protein [Rubrivivax sp.]MCA3259743.1 hypothetical protein [Rubrivivax sp.]MCE2911987.1 DUF6152 family protein [Rubrivivax sp.]MCZ8032250.1 DUF6152 family protein [Rubrivivax sp.]